MKRGIVFEIHQSRATILKADGEFLSVPASEEWKPGDIVLLKEPRLKKFMSSYKLLATAAVFVLVVLAGFFGSNLYFTKTALISLDVNPSIEIGINRFGRIISVDAKNDEGEAILESLKIKNQDYADAIPDLLEQEELASYFEQESYVYLTVQADDVSMKQQLLNQMERYKADIQSHHDQIIVEYSSVESGMVEQAHAHGVTAGKYKMLLELAKLDSEFEFSEYSHHSVGDLMETIQEKCLSNFGNVPQSEEDHGHSHHEEGH